MVTIAYLSAEGQRGTLGRLRVLDEGADLVGLS